MKRKMFIRLKRRKKAAESKSEKTSGTVIFIGSKKDWCDGEPEPVWTMEQALLAMK